MHYIPFRVQIDCRQFFQPGQLAVAVGRVTSEEGLRIVNFSPEAVIKQPIDVINFLSKESASLCCDLSCCFDKRYSYTLILFTFTLKCNIVTQCKCPQFFY